MKNTFTITGIRKRNESKYGSVKGIRKEDLLHYCSESGAEESAVGAEYDRALSNCLLADIRYKLASGESISDAERVLLLFLDPLGGEDDEVLTEEERAEIRERITDGTFRRIAEETGLAEGYVRRLISGGSDSEET